MPGGEACLLDSNILLRISKSDDPQHAAISYALHALVGHGVRLCYTSQTLAEFWNASTRPARQERFWFECRRNRSFGPRDRTGLRIPPGQPGSSRPLAVASGRA